MTISIKATEIAEIDRQHRQLVKAVDDLTEYVGGDYDFSASLTALSALVDYKETHFTYEEALMVDWGYPKIDDHIAEHRAFTDQVSALWQAVEAGESVSTKILDMIRTWVIDHINEEDAQYAAFISCR